MQEEFKWWQNAVVYQLYPRSFLDSNEDGIGDIKGIIKKLDYLNDGSENSLGIDAIWLNPIYPSPQFDFGYDIMDYEAIDPRYGTMEDFELLLKEAHKRKIRIVMDIVPSVTSHLHPWFIESRSGRNNPKREWYIWRDSPATGRYPNNWLGMFGGRAWEWDEKTRQFYYHNSLPEQPDLNWKNPEVAKAILSCMEFWFKKGVDGFRIDVLNFSHKDDQFRNNPHCLGIRPYDMQKHIYDRNRPEAVEVGRMMRRLADSYGGRMLVAEIFIDDPVEAAKYYGENGDGLNMVFNFSFAYSKFSAEGFRSRIEKWDALTGTMGWPCWFLSNHDISRHITRYAEGRWTVQKAKTAAAMLLTLRGTPFLYMGEEIGMQDVKIKRSELMDPVGKHYWPFNRGRDRSRTPMQWSEDTYAGFSNTKPWLPVHKNYPYVNVAREDVDCSSLLNWYRKLIWLRKKYTALASGKFTFCDFVPKGILAYIREKDDTKILVAHNMTRDKKTVAFDSFLKQKYATGLIESYNEGTGQIPLDEVVLKPYGTYIILVK